MLNVAILIFDDVEVLDFAGPFEVFAVTDEVAEKPFNVFTVAQKSDVVARNGLGLKSKYTLDNAPSIDVLVIPGGEGARKVEMYNNELLEWIKKVQPGTKLVMSVCTGSFILAAAGFLNNASATTHWKLLDKFEKSYPNIKVIRGVKYVDEGKFLTAAGISAGLDASFYVVSKLTTKAIALDTAKHMEYDLHTI